MTKKFIYRIKRLTVFNPEVSRSEKSCYAVVPARSILFSHKTRCCRAGEVGVGVVGDDVDDDDDEVEGEAVVVVEGEVEDVDDDVGVVGVGEVGGDGGGVGGDGGDGGGERRRAAVGDAATGGVRVVCGVLARGAVRCAVVSGGG